MFFDNNRRYNRKYSVLLDNRIRWLSYVDGYKRAGDLLIKKCQPVNKNILVYPICFMYRHYIEIQLKDIIKKYEEFIIGHVGCLDGIPKNRAHHKLDTLWDDCKELLDKSIVVYGCDYQCSGDTLKYSKKKLEQLKKKLGYNKSDLDFLEDKIKQFSKIDKGSYSFRYPIDKQGNLSLPSLDYINLKELSKEMSRVGHLLNSYSACIYGWLDEFKSMKEEILN
ncbi:MAG: hypothetical protein B5M53_00775 [Candidatus Cloacimonas sp. 4484_209]|nr:MAG: hypothetical protein B5M53_00775 [Candidatus Cloacimonas sp. 4484_209]